MILMLLNLERQNTIIVLKYYEDYWWHKNQAYVVWNYEKWTDIYGKQISAQFLDEASSGAVLPKVERANVSFLSLKW